MLRFSGRLLLAATSTLFSQQAVGITTSIFPARYVQGPGALNLLGEELARLGKKALVVQDPQVEKLYGKKLQSVLSGKVSAVMELLKGAVCDEEIKRISSHNDVDLVVGIGGGCTMDTSKAVGYELKVPTAVVPTLAASDAACSALSVIYTKDHVFDRYLFVPHNPNLVLVDSEIIAKAPARFLVSGMGDALATWFEAESCSLGHKPNMTGRLGSAMGLSLARLCYETLLEYGVLAKQACECGVTCPALERVIEANIFLSGIGFESAGLGGAHAIHNGLMVIPEAHKCWHGERVTIGLLATLLLTNRPPQVIDTVYGFCESVGLPTTLADIGCGDVSDEVLLQAATVACAPEDTMQNETGTITPTAVFNAMKIADYIGRSRAQKKH
ncbi:glycerol dehydrogenase [Trypanosoma conorhini]|uniref:Glycerol dehydrogenase n=1 Tax=Trypanosoma conorhini TaxID=83891 RepID=A0A422P2E9_9TRYP|nr:glycerol dehydrogenase [Trypanosoma conorhini]RNF11888.1 glycerol dehydrogenase [Trypanosoma conorhini]